MFAPPRSTIYLLDENIPPLFLQQNSLQSELSFELDTDADTLDFKCHLGRQ
jgi:hypothetical protein